jgi:solute carrier family 25 ornithine transporter 2/15
MSDQEVLGRRAVTRDLYSATIGSVFCCYTGQPFDTVKVRMQTNPGVYSGIFRTVAKTSSEEGVRAFWKGAVPTAMGMALENAMAFGVNEALKRAFPDPSKGSGADPEARPDLSRPFMMGAITGCCSALVLLPSEVVKAKTQVAIGSTSSGDIAREMMRRQGVRSMFTGFEAQIMRDGPFYAFFFGSYDLLCYVFRTNVPSMPDELNFFLSGGFAGMLGWAAAMPFDVPKTNVQASWDSKVVGSYFPELLRIGRERGITGLYSGLGPTLARAFPANAALFLGVELSKKAFDDFIWNE